MSEECRALLKVVYDRSAASNASRNVLRRMLDEDMSLAMSAEPPELPPRLDYTQCHTHGNTDQLCTNLCNLPEVKGFFRPEEKKARLIKNMAPRTQRVEHEHLQPQLLLPHFAPQPLNAWVNVPVAILDPHGPLHVVLPSTEAIAAAVVRQSQDA